MTRTLLLSGFALALMTMTGCAMCAHPFDYDYGAFGGSWERADPANGRVGSAFHAAGARLVQTDEPTEADTDSSTLPAPEDRPDDSVLVPRQANAAGLNDDAPEPDLIFLQ